MPVTYLGVNLLLSDICQTRHSPWSQTDLSRILLGSFLVVWAWEMCLTALNFRVLRYLLFNDKMILLKVIQIDTAFPHRHLIGEVCFNYSFP